MAENKAEITDLVWGVYRRQYAGYVRGRRINSISLEAEAWFWRVHSSADDFGNADADPSLCHAATVGRRQIVSVEDVGRWLREMLDQELIRNYEVGGESYLHIVGFLTRQVGGRNGRRIRRYPESPWDALELAAGESGGILGNPGASVLHEDENEDENDNENQNEEDGVASVPASTARAAKAAAAKDNSPIILTFPTIAGKRTKEKTWFLREKEYHDLSETFVGVNVPMECRKALHYLNSNRQKQKTAGGMSEFLYRWMAREQNGGQRGGGGNGREESPESYARRVAAKGART